MSWRGLASLLSTNLVVTGLGGFALLMAAPSLPAQVVGPVAAVITGAMPRTPDVTTSSKVSLIEADPTHLPITRLAISTIELDTPVVPAPLVEHDGVSTWEVPKFVAGHALGTAYAGEVGNALLIGHLTSLTLGNVFEHLNAIRPGALVQVFSHDLEFDYRVSNVRVVSRTNVSVLEPGTVPSLLLMTCSGAWLPDVRDYNERLVVNAERVSALR
jgi:sortase A